MDAVYVVSPYWSSLDQKTISSANGWPSPGALLDRYSDIAGYDPRRSGSGKDFEIAKVFHQLRSGTISHGIHARTVSGQVSSEFSHIYFENTKKSLDSALDRVRKLNKAEMDKPRL